MKILKNFFSATIVLSLIAISQMSVAQIADPEDCACEGKLTTLTLRYLGASATSIWVFQQNGQQIYYDETLMPGEVFALTGTQQKGNKVSNTTLGSYIDLFFTDGTSLNIHTSCSVEINEGDVIGDFRVIAGTSRKNGKICINPDPPACDSDIEDCPDNPDGDG